VKRVVLSLLPRHLGDDYKRADMKRKKDGTFKEGVKTGASLAAGSDASNRETKVKPGFGDQGDQPT
jgi:hypothetical protein